MTERSMHQYFTSILVSISFMKSEFRVTNQLKLFLTFIIYKI